MFRLYVVLALVLASIVAGCRQAATEEPTAAPTTPPKPDEPTPTPEPESTYKQAPMLDGMDLPPVDERLPQNPFVYDGPDSPGTYGGTMERVMMSGANPVLEVMFVNPAYLLVTTTDHADIIAQLAESYSANDDATEFTIHLRKGLRWSDGELFTAADIMFFWENLVEDEEVGFPRYLGAGVDMEQVDDYTVKFISEKPNAMLLALVAHPNGGNYGWFPKHYCSQFHAAYNEDAQKLAEEADFDTWAQNLTAKCGRTAYARNAELPTLGAWKLTQDITGATTDYEYERNPYFWAVDSSGQQLPYVDRVKVTVLADKDAVGLRVAAGEVDYQWHLVNAQDLKAFYLENAAAGEYEVHDIPTTAGNAIAIHVHQTSRDEMHAPILKNKDFRIGLSHAINRQEMIDTLWLGLGTPRQISPLPQSPYYLDEEMESQFIEYDVALANEYLDKVLPDKDGDGFRLGPDGKRFILTFPVVEQGQHPDVAEMLARYWEEVGLQVEVRPGPRVATHELMGEQGLWDITIWGGGPGIDIPLQHAAYTPATTTTGDEFYAEYWAEWYRNPESPTAMEPPPEVMKQVDLVRKAEQTTDLAGRIAIWKEILEITKEQFWLIGISSAQPGFMIISNDVKNIPDPFYLDWPHGGNVPLRGYGIYLVR
jgi:peptide/nickel transport system substrate-binding protein